MRTSMGLMLALLVGLSPAALRAADEPQAIVEKAVKNLGGIEKLSKYNGARMKHKGNIAIMGVEADYAGDMIYHHPDQFKMDISMDFMGQKIQVIQVYNKGKGYVSAAGMNMELTGDQLDALKNEVYANYVESLFPLVGDQKKNYTLSLVGEEKINDKPAIGVKVASKDRKDINLYFDKETGLLIKSSRRAMDFTGANEINQETFYSEYKDADGIKQPMKFRVLHDGKKAIEGEITEVKFVEKIDESEFAKP